MTPNAPTPTVIPGGGFKAADLVALACALAPTVIVLCGLLFGGCQ